MANLTTTVLCRAPGTASEYGGPNNYFVELQVQAPSMADLTTTL